MPHIIAKSRTRLPPWRWQGARSTGPDAAGSESALLVKGRARPYARLVSRRYPDDPSPWTLIERSYLFRRPPWLTLRQDHLRLPNGREIPEYWVSEYPPWVNVVAVTPADCVVLVRQYRPGLQAVHFEIPAGVVDATDATPEAAARRELLEETGYAGGRWSRLLTLSANPALQSNLTHSFLAEEVEAVAAPAHEATEDLRVHVVPLGDLPRLIDAGEIAQALHAAPLLRYLLRRQSGSHPLARQESDEEATS
jgi:8-oxo-dGTP pyrophosphatase MutT (NUDIX family)